MNTFITIISGVAVFVVGQIIVKLVIDPIQAYKSTVGEISISLIKYANVFASPGVHPKEKNDEASESFRFLASVLSSRINLIPKYKWLVMLFGLPSIDNIHTAKKDLIFLSNNLHTRGNDIQGISPAELNCRKAEEISDLLDIYIPPNERAYRADTDA